MKKIVQLVVLAAVTAITTGCASTKAYFCDRGRDAADIFTIAGGVGLGGKVRIGPVHAGLILYGADVGLYAGDIVMCDGGPCRAVIGGELIGWSSELMYPCSRNELRTAERLRAKWYFAESPVLPFITTVFNENQEESVRFPHPYWTQCEVQLGLLLSTRLGFNPGELVDFVLGWFGFDIYDDDVEARKQKTKSDRTKNTTR